MIQIGKKGEMKTEQDRGESTDRDQDRNRTRDAQHDWQPDVAEQARGRDQDDRGAVRGAARPQSHKRSMMPNLLITAGVALMSGVIGAVGYSSLLGSKPGEPFSSRSKTEGGSSQESSSSRKSGGGSDTGSANESSTQASTSSSSAGFGSAQQADELKQQIMNLNKRMDRIGEQIDRLQELLSLAVPLLQRLAPKH
jgi:hypothetical protein